MDGRTCSQTDNMTHVPRVLQRTYGRTLLYLRDLYKKTTTKVYRPLANICVYVRTFLSRIMMKYVTYRAKMMDGRIDRTARGNRHTYELQFLDEWIDCLEREL